MNRLNYLLLAGFGSVTAAVAIFSFIGIYRKAKQKSISSKENLPQSKNIFSLLNEPEIDIQLIAHVLKENPESARSVDKKGRLPLHLALSKSQPNIRIGTEGLLHATLNNPQSSTF
jgi:hypothetical protein